MKVCIMKSDYETTLTLGKKLYQRGRYDEAHKIFSDISKYEHAGIEFFKFWADTLLKLNDSKGALLVLEKIARITPEDHTVFIKIALTFEKMGNHKKAIESFRMAVDKDARLSENSLVNERLASLYFKEKLYKEAIESFNKNYDQNKSKPEFLSKLGFSYFEEKKYTDAKNIYLRLLKVKPDFNSAFNVAVCEKNTKNLKSAILYFLEAEKYDNSQRRLYSELGDSYRNLGRHKEAIAAYKKVLTFEPNRRNVFYLIGICYSALGNNECIDWLEKSIAVTDKKSEPYFQLAHFYKRQNMFSKALANYLKALEYDGRNSRILSEIGLCFLRLGKQEQALEYCERATKINSQDSNAFISLGVVLYQGFDDFSAAIDLYSKALELNPNDAQTRYNLSLCYLKSGNYKVAWDMHRSRWKTNQFITNKSYQNVFKTLKSINAEGVPEWDGVQRERVVLIAEQGIGDQIMFSSVIPEIYKKVEELSVLIDPRLLKVFQMSFPKKINFFGKIPELKQVRFTHYVQLADAFGMFREKNEDFKNNTQKFLKHGRIDYQKAVNSIGKNFSSEKKWLGLSWRSENPLNGKNRSIELQKLVEILDDNFEGLSLQYGANLSELRKVKKTTGKEVLLPKNLNVKDDFYTVSAYLKYCKAVVTIDNSLAHFCGALGVKTFLLLSYVSDWRWDINEGMGIYKNVEILKQNNPNDWDPVLSTLKKKLEQIK